MAKLPSQANRLAVTLMLTLFIFSAFFISGFTVSTLKVEADQNLPANHQPDFDNLREAPPLINPNLVEAPEPRYAPPADGGGAVQAAAGSAQQAPGDLVDVIKNGGFESWGDGGIALEWEGYRNGQAWASWYQESWPEAVFRGEFAQLMEIFQVEPNIQDRVVAIYQTVPVMPNATYVLTFYALMRSQAQAADRNIFEHEMAWGVDFAGGGEYQAVETWNTLSLNEQFRLGSTGQYPEDIPLQYQLITGTIQTGDSNQITLYIRGLKKFSTGTEVNFDVDEVALVGPAPGIIVKPTVISPQPTPGVSLPVSGATVTGNISLGVLILGGLVLGALGFGAVTGLRQKRRE